MSKFQTICLRDLSGVIGGKKDKKDKKDNSEEGEEGSKDGGKTENGNDGKTQHKPAELMKIPLAKPPPQGKKYEF